MRPVYNGVKYYSSTDLSLGLCFERAVAILDSFQENNVYTDINEIIELYNVIQIVSSPGIKDEYSKPYLEKLKKLNKPIALFFKGIDDNTLLDNYRSVGINYLDDFWTIFEKYKVCNNISDSVFTSLLYEPGAELYRILKHRGIVDYYDEIIATFMRQSNQSARIIIAKFLEKTTFNTEKEYFLPSSLDSNEFEEIIDNYIDSESPNVGLLQLVASSRSSKECPLSDALRLKAKRKARTYWETHIKEGIGFSYEMRVCFKSIPDIISYEKTDDLKYQINYDINWIKENLDFPTLLNNFIYLFGYVDPCYRCSFVSIQSKLGPTERVLGIKGKEDYEIGAAFNLADLQSSIQMQGYSSVLAEFNIRIEDLIQWFFSEYLKTEFKADGFVIHMPSTGTTTLEKCRILPSEMDGIFKQYKLFVTTHSIDREFLEMSSNPVRFHDLPSMIAKKYAYVANNDIFQEQHLLFSNQSMLNYLPEHEEEWSFYDLLKKNTVKLSDYPEWEKAKLDFLERRDDIVIDDTGIIKLNIPRVHLLKDLYDHDVICVSYYRKKDLIEQLVAAGDLQYESKLFSLPEQHYLNYMLNKSEYSNGLDLRNKYIHSTYPLDKAQQERDYIQLLKVMILVILKINEEFCLVNPRSEIALE